ncbi:MAG TPA: hypothetical protein VII40_20480 [Xanthobacteraceae bacterium]
MQRAASTAVKASAIEAIENFGFPAAVAAVNPHCSLRFRAF